MSKPMIEEKRVREYWFIVWTSGRGKDAQEIRTGPFDSRRAAVGHRAKAQANDSYMYPRSKIIETEKPPVLSRSPRSNRVLPQSQGVRAKRNYA